MGKFLARLIIFLFIPSLLSAQIPALMDSLKFYLCNQYINIDTTGTALLSKQDLFHFINFGIQQTCEDFPAIEKLDTLYVYSDSEGVSLPSDFLRIEAAFRMVDSTIRVPFAITTVKEILIEQATGESVKQSKASIFSPNNAHVFKQRLMFTPKYVRDDSLNILLYYYARDTWKIHKDSSTQIISKYREKILLYAAAQIWMLRGRPDKAALYQALYAVGLNPTREEEGQK